MNKGERECVCEAIIGDKSVCYNRSGKSLANQSERNEKWEEAYCLEELDKVDGGKHGISLKASISVLKVQMHTLVRWENAIRLRCGLYNLVTTC